MCVCGNPGQETTSIWLKPEIMHAMLHLWYGMVWYGMVWYGSGMWVCAVLWGVQRYSSHAEKKTMKFLWLPQKWKRMDQRDCKGTLEYCPCMRAWFESWPFLVYKRDTSDAGVDCYSWAAPATAALQPTLPSFHNSTNQDPVRHYPPAQLDMTPIRANPLALR